MNPLKEGEVLKYQKGLYEVFDVRAETITLIPILELVERGELKRKCDFSRKPLVWQTKNIYPKAGEK